MLLGKGCLLSDTNKSLLFKVVQSAVIENCCYLTEIDMPKILSFLFLSLLFMIPQGSTCTLRDQNTRQIHKGGPPWNVWSQHNVRATAKDNTGQNTDKWHTPSHRIEIKFFDPVGNRIRAAELECRGSNWPLHGDGSYVFFKGEKLAYIWSCKV